MRSSKQVTAFGGSGLVAAVLLPLVLYTSHGTIETAARIAVLFGALSTLTAWRCLKEAP